jgi:hypothetical protein
MPVINATGRLLLILDCPSFGAQLPDNGEQAKRDYLFASPVAEHGTATYTALEAARRPGRDATDFADKYRGVELAEICEIRAGDAPGFG